MLKKNVRVKLTRKPKQIQPLTQQSLVKMVKKISLGEQETKYGQVARENVQLYHNVGESGAGNGFLQFKNIMATAQGTLQENRVGDEITAQGLAVRLYLANKGDRPNVNYRIIAVSVPKDQATAGAPTGLFENAVGNKLIDYINTDQYKVLYDKTIHIGSDSGRSTSNGAEQTRKVQFYLPFKNRKVRYEGDNGTVPKYQNNIISFGVIPYDSFGTLQTDNVSSMACSYRFYFKDA